MSRPARPTWRLSALAYTALFFVGGLLIVTAVVAIGLWRFTQIDSGMAREQQRLARAELTERLGAIEHEAGEMAHTLADDNEVRQQLRDPTYYGYWVHNRAKVTAHAPEWVEAIALYESDGRALEPTPPSMPEQIDGQGSGLRLYAGKPHFYYFAPVHAMNDKYATSGYLAISADPITAIREIGKLERIDPTSLSFEGIGTTLIPSKQVATRALYDVRPNPYRQRMRSLVFDTGVVLFAAFAGMFLVGFWGLSYLIVNPVRALAGWIEALRAGQHDAQLTRALPVKELALMRDSFKEYHDELTSLALIDPLTRVANRRAFEQDIQAIEHDSKHRVHLVLIDCVRFKSINDTYGHAAGDRVLTEIAKNAQSYLRAEDKLYRIGGDEFAVLFPRTDTASTEQIATRCVRELRNIDPETIDVPCRLTVTAGIGFIEPNEVFDMLRLQRRADTAMYRAKQPYEGPVVTWSHEFGENEALAHRTIEVIQNALQRPENYFLMHYQPIYDSHQQLVYYEALARISDDERMLTPQEFFPIVEHEQMDDAFDEAVVAAVAHDITNGVVAPGTPVGVNVAAPTLVRKDLLEIMAPLADLAANHPIYVEITETALVTRLNEAGDNLKRVREAGLYVVLDDFGAGYSSFRYLTSFPVDLIKFDIALIHGLSRQDRFPAMVADLAASMRDVGYRIIAEGIEDEEMLRRVYELGFHGAQGFLLGHPQRPAQERLPSALMGRSQSG